LLGCLFDQTEGRVGGEGSAEDKELGGFGYQAQANLSGGQSGMPL
jgi:hypothetical protein